MEFGTSGYTMDNIFVLYDRASDSVWYPQGNELAAVAGKRKGSSIPFVDEPAPVSLAERLVDECEVLADPVEPADLEHRQRGGRRRPGEDH